MELDNIASLKHVISLNHLAIVDLSSLEPGEFQSCRQILVDLQGQLLQRRSLLQYKRLGEVRFLSRNLGVDADDIQCMKDRLLQYLEVTACPG